MLFGESGQLPLLHMDSTVEATFPLRALSFLDQGEEAPCLNDVIDPRSSSIPALLTCGHNTEGAAVGENEPEVLSEERAGLEIKWWDLGEKGRRHGGNLAHSSMILYPTWSSLSFLVLNINASGFVFFFSINIVKFSTVSPASGTP